VAYEDMARIESAEPSCSIRARVERARQRQRERLGSDQCNAKVAVKRLRDVCALDDECRTLLAAAVSRLYLSARAHDRILRVARTIADLATSDKIGAQHLAEAIGYRSLDRFLKPN
jgi:magnesium chelatase family protein